MSGLLNFLPNAVGQGQLQITYGTVTTPIPTSFSDLLYVVEPDWSIEFPMAIASWPACHGSVLPSANDAVLLVVDSRGHRRCVWWEGQTSFPSPNGASILCAAPTGVAATDTTNLTSFLNAINARPGSEGIVAPGTYQVNAPLPQVTSPVDLHGAIAGIVPATKAGTVISYAAGVPGLSLGSAAQMTHVHDLYLESASSTLGADDGISGPAHGVVYERLVVDGFGRDGINIDTTSSGNANNCSLRDVRCVSNKRDGLRPAGGNSNVITFENCSAVNNGGWGFNSRSAACLFLNAHAEANTLGAYQDVGNGNFFLLPYTETGTGDNVTLSGNGTSWLEGTFSSSVITNTATNANVQVGGETQKVLRLTDPATGHKWAFNVGSFGAGYLSLADNTNSQNIFDVDANNVRAEWLIPLLLTGGINGTTTATAPGAGGAGALPATPTGYLTVKINGTNRQVPYY